VTSDGGPVLVLDLGHRVAQRRAERLAAQLGLAGHPRAQVLLLAAGQPRDGDGIGGLALHEGERLQDGVVQVGGHALALVLPRRLDVPAVRAGQPGDEQRSGHEDEGGRPDGQEHHELQQRGAADVEAGQDEADERGARDEGQPGEPPPRRGRRGGGRVPAGRAAAQALPGRADPARQPEPAAQVVGHEDEPARRRAEDEDDGRQLHGEGRGQDEPVGEPADAEDEGHRHEGHQGHEEHGRRGEQRPVAPGGARGAGSQDEQGGDRPRAGHGQRHAAAADSPEREREPADEQRSRGARRAAGGIRERTRAALGGGRQLHGAHRVASVRAQGPGRSRAIARSERSCSARRVRQERSRRRAAARDRPAVSGRSSTSTG
jgi:hypothetical protein